MMVRWGLVLLVPSVLGQYRNSVRSMGAAGAVGAAGGAGGFGVEAAYEPLASPVPAPIYANQDSIMSDTLANIIINVRRWSEGRCGVGREAETWRSIAVRRGYSGACKSEGDRLLIYAKRMTFDVGFCSGPITYRQFNEDRSLPSSPVPSLAPEANPGARPVPGPDQGLLRRRRPEDEPGHGSLHLQT